MARLTDPRALRFLLAQLALAALVVGIPATVTPHGFYTSWPYFAHWVSPLGPYNHHLTSDVGEFELAFGLLFAWAAWRPAPALVVPLCLGFSLSQIVHTIFHIGHVGGLSTLQAALEIGGLATVSLLPLLVAGACWRVARLPQKLTPTSTFAKVPN